MVTIMQRMEGRGEPREARLQEIECWIDENVRRALASKNVAKSRELELLRVRLERVAQRIEMLRRGKK